MNNTPKYIIDDILHVFNSHGNLCLILGGASGQELPDGSEVSEPIVTIVLPLSRVSHLTSQLGGISEFVKTNSVEAEEIRPEIPKPNEVREILGRAIEMKF